VPPHLCRFQRPSRYFLGGSSYVQQLWKSLSSYDCINKLATGSHGVITPLLLGMAVSCLFIRQHQPPALTDMSAINQASSGPKPHHGRSASDGPLPSAVQNTPKNGPCVDNESPSTHPCRKKTGKNRPQMPNPQAKQSFNAGIHTNPSYPSPQVNQVSNAGYHPTYPSPQANPSHTTGSLFTNPIAIQAYSAGLHYNPTILTKGKHWYFYIQIAVPPPSIMNVRHDMSPRQRAKGRLHQLTLNKKMINEQRGFVRGSIERMEMRLEALEVILIHESPSQACSFWFPDYQSGPS